ncbi:MAG: ZIP family metal transporter [Candidatus Tectomicrobia bacterium]|nr:ZIP family metal transporter [Candidatus Tectomicrobia bacterium]
MTEMNAAAGKVTTASEGLGTRRSRAALWGLGLFPLVILGAIVYVFLTKGSSLVGAPPVPADALLKLNFERVVFEPSRIVAQVRNTGPAPATVAQVMVNEALWNFSVSPDSTLPRLSSATVSIPYPWIETEPVKLTLITSNGLTFTHTTEISVATPRLGWKSVGSFSLLGVYAGVIPVFLGLLWLPFLRRLGKQWLGFLIALTGGILVFLGVDVLAEGFEAAGRVPGVFHGVVVLSVGLIVGVLGLLAAGRWSLRGGEDRPEEFRRLALAYMVAVGIGLHNLGEGLAIGAAYTTGQIALGALLVIGFTVHNATEGFGILGPVARQKVALAHLLGFGLIAGGPTVLGTLLGGFAYYDVVAAFFFALGAGAIFYVVYELAKLVLRPGADDREYALGFVGLLIGMAIMFLTALLVPTA